MNTISNEMKMMMMSVSVSRSLAMASKPEDKGKYPMSLTLTHEKGDKKTPMMILTWHEVDGKMVPAPMPDFPYVGVSLDIAGHKDGADDRQYALYSGRGYEIRDCHLDYITDDNGYNVPTFATVAHPKFGTEGYVFHYRFKHPKTGKTSKWFKGGVRIITNRSENLAMDAEAEQTMKAKKSAKK